MLVLPLLARLGWVQLAAPAFHPVGPIVGGALLGIAASLAGGCTVGHSLAGIPLPSVGGLVTSVFIVLGSWSVGCLELRRRARLE